MDIRFEQAAFVQQNVSQIEAETKRFRMLLAKSMSNTMFQCMHFDVIEHGIELSDYVRANDISKTTFDKIKKWNDNVDAILHSDDLHETEQIAKVISSTVSK